MSLNPHFFVSQGPFDILEVDWVLLADYLDDTLASILYWLCSSSHQSSWSVHLKMKLIPWIYLFLHHVDLDVEKKVLELLDGICTDKDIFIC